MPQRLNDEARHFQHTMRIECGNRPRRWRNASCVQIDVFEFPPWQAWIDTIAFRTIAIGFTPCEHPLNEQSNEAAEAEMTPCNGCVEGDDDGDDGDGRS